MNKTEEAAFRIKKLIEEIENSDANDYHKAKMREKLDEVIMSMLDAHVMIAECKTVLIAHNLHKED